MKYVPLNIFSFELRNSNKQTGTDSCLVEFVTKSQASISAKKMLALGLIQDRFSSSYISQENGCTTLFINISNKNELSRDEHSTICNTIAEKIKNLNIAQLYIPTQDILTQRNDYEWWLSMLTVAITRYLSFRPYKSIKRTVLKLRKIILFDARQIKNFKALAAKASATATSVDICKYLSDLPSNHCTPDWFAKTSSALFSSFKNVRTKIFKEKELAKAQMNLIIAVGQGSHNGSRLLQIEYSPPSAKGAPIVLVGKGVTFDTGGISLKPSRQMDEMKYDMCGAATVIATMHALAALGINQKVIALTPLVENMPGGNSINPGDIIAGHNKKTVEILNTDAEGRLILADALSYAAGFKPRAIIDMATLTGACIVALGKQYGALLSNNQQLADALIKSSVTSSDYFWQLPLVAAYKQQMKSNFADLANIGSGGEAGTITAALFLQEFVENDIPWAHLDIAGIAWKSASQKGATGRPVPMMIDYFSNLDNS